MPGPLAPDRGGSIARHAPQSHTRRSTPPARRRTWGACVSSTSHPCAVCELAGELEIFQYWARAKLVDSSAPISARPVGTIARRAPAAATRMGRFPTARVRCVCWPKRSSAERISSLAFKLLTSTAQSLLAVGDQEPAPGEAWTARHSLRSPGQAQPSDRHSPPQGRSHGNRWERTARCPYPWLDFSKPSSGGCGDVAGHRFRSRSAGSRCVPRVVAGPRRPPLLRSGRATRAARRWARQHSRCARTDEVRPK